MVGVAVFSGVINILMLSGSRARSICCRSTIG
jgi:hypothetical protein